jgi:hypothetical protein
VPRKVFRSARHAVELQLLAQAVWLRPECGGTEADAEQSAGDVIGVLPASFDFASVFAPGTPIDVFIPWPLADQKNLRETRCKSSEG